MTIYQTNAIRVNVSGTYNCTVNCTVEVWGHKSACHKDDLLKTVCKAYIHDKREDLTEREAIIAHLAGYDVADNSGDVWPSKMSYKEVLDSSSPFGLVFPPFAIKTEPDTIEVPREELEALKQRIEELEKGK